MYHWKRLLTTSPTLRSLTTTASSTSRRKVQFDAKEATVETVHRAIFSGEVSCRDVVQRFLARIKQYNPQINAIISLNPDVLKQADQLDNDLTKQTPPGLLFGVPILLKDNFDALGMPTTAGSQVLKDLWPSKDAPVVEALRREGAIILGKTNLHEFALEGLTVSSLGGQTRNPYDLTRTPGGSSGGSGAAVAASLAVMATGTDTVNSLRSPASANSLYSFRPSPGLISRRGIVPVSSSQDAVGMIGRTLRDIWLALLVMTKPNLPAMQNIKKIQTKTHNDISQIGSSMFPQSKPIEDMRFGVLQNLLDRGASHETDPVNKAMDQVCSVLKREGATVIAIEDAETYNIPRMLTEMDVQMYEIAEQIDSYLASPTVRGSHPSSFEEIFVRKADKGFSVPLDDPRYLIIPSQYQYIRTALASNISSPEYHHRKARISLLTQALHRSFHDHGLDALIYPQQRNLVVPIGSASQHGRNGILAAVTGSPVVCIPIGFSQPTASAPVGLPIGMEILGLPRTEARLFEIARAIDEKMSVRRPPNLGQLDQQVADYEHVPKLRARSLSHGDARNYPPDMF